MGTRNPFLNITTVAQTLKATINKWNSLKLRRFYKAKESVNKTKRQLIELENIFTIPTSGRVIQNIQINQEIRHHNFK